MRSNLFIGVFVLVVGLLLPVQSMASTITIDFGGLSGANQSAFPNPYTEDGFTLTPTTLGGLEQGLSFGDPRPSLLVGPVGLPVAGTFDITAGGSPFTFLSYDYHSQSGGSSFSIEGFLNNIPQFIQTNNVGLTLSSSFSTLGVTPLLVDRIAFTITPNGFTSSVNLDNFVLNTDAPVPEPASLTLLGLGLAGMGARRWRQRKA